MKRTIAILEKLISFDTTSCYSNLALINYIADFLDNLGIKSNLIYNETNNKANLFATIGKPNKSGIILSGHTDVVPVLNQKWDDNPFILTSKDDKLFGRGTADMKSFIACSLAMVEKITQKDLKTPIHLAFSYDEELGCQGVGKMIDFIKNNSIQPKLCIVGEPTSMQIVTAHKGNMAFKVTCKGEESHSSLAPLYQNAIHLALDFITKLRKMQTDIIVNGNNDDAYDIPHSTVHVGVINGGTARNIVPNNCEFFFEIRYLDQDDTNEYLYKINNIPNEIQKRNNDDIIIEPLFNYPGLNNSELNNDVFSFIAKTANYKKISKVAYGTEAGFFKNILDIPTIVLGPGDIQQAHKPNEYVALKQIKKCDSFLNKLYHFCLDY